MGALPITADGAPYAEPRRHHRIALATCALLCAESLSHLMEGRIGSVGVGVGWLGVVGVGMNGWKT